MGYESEIKKLEGRWLDNPKQYFAPLADAYRKNGDYEKAIEIIADGLAERPNYVSAYIVLGRTRVGMGESAEASHVFEQVLEFDGENIIALSQLGDLAEEAGDLEGAIGWLRRLIEVDPMNQAAARLEQLETAAGSDGAGATGGGADASSDDSGRGQGISFADVFSEDAPDSVPDSPDSTEVFGEITPLLQSEDEHGSAPVGDEEEADVAEEAVPEAVERRPALDEIETVVDMVAANVVDHQDPADVPTLQMEGISEEALAAANVEEAEEEMLPVEPELETDTGIESFGETTETVDEPMGMIEPSELPEPDEGDAPTTDARSPRLSRSLENIPVIFPDDVPEDEMQGISDNFYEPSPEPVVTETMAQVFAQQGMVEQAKQVYSQLLEAQPDNERFRAEIEKLDLMTPAPFSPSGRRAPRCSVIETGGKSSRSYLQEILSAVVVLDVAPPPDPVKPFAGPEKPQAPRSRLSFDDFYGAAGAPDAVDEPGDEAPEDEDFKSWLKGLKS